MLCGHYFDVGRVRASEREVVATDCDVNRVAERRYFTHANRGAFGDAHVHDATANLTVVVEFRYRALPTDFDVVEGHVQLHSH